MSGSSLWRNAISSANLSVMPIADRRFEPLYVVACIGLLISLSCRVQDIVKQLKHPGHRRRMVLVCHAWRDATPITSYDVVLRPLQTLTELNSRLAVITARHSSLTSLSFRCALVAGWVSRAAISNTGFLPHQCQHSDRSEWANRASTRTDVSCGCTSSLLMHGWSYE